MRRAFLIAVALGIALIARGAAGQAPAPVVPAQQDCAEQLKIVLKHDQEIDNARRQLEIRISSQGVEIDTLRAEVARLKTPAAPVAPVKPVEPPK